jgi:hypothetical protein
MHYTCAEEGRATSGLTHRMQLAVRRLREQEQLLSEQKTKLDEMGLKPDEVKRAMDPLRSFRQQLAEETETGNVRKINRRPVYQTNKVASATRPGPKASATQGRGADRCWRRSTTNRTVAEDMLPYSARIWFEAWAACGGRFNDCTTL